MKQVIKMITEKEVLNALSQIIDPDFNQDIVSLGFVQNIKIEKSSVAFDIALTTPACPVKDFFQKKAEDLIKKIPGVGSVQVRMTTLPRKSSQAGLNTQSGLAGVKSIIAVSSCKGGVGKSTLAATLALELARRGYKVGLLDCDIHGPSVPALFNAQNEKITINGMNQLIPVEKFHLKIMSFGFLLGDAPAVMRGPMVSQYIQQILHGTDWGDLDYLFMDMPPGTGDVQLTITQSVKLNGAVIVTTRQTLSLVDVARGILMFEKVDVPMLGVIENMSYFICDNCDKKHYIFGGKASDSLTDRFGLEMLAEIPVLPQLTARIDGHTTHPSIVDAVDHMIRSLGKTSILKKQIPAIRFDESNTYLTWPSGEVTSVSHRDLRLSCRCALCINEMTGEQILQETDVPAAIAPKKITPLGNYAVGIEWNDGHASGIYPYTQLKEKSLSFKNA
ncbi:MAG TPA: hypothetical protein DD723_00715 [Candidatus Omnitrophica bacterium]|nr:MAG: hypothetical protein A2Z81_09390 [Omnitrophica WOR_2 bacterium GWA2_45_18]HBR14053.1 hypothetical protein [Candidatus Omnitrophota bacterium]